jgi:hypothetical protein
MAAVVVLLRQTLPQPPDPEIPLGGDNGGQPPLARHPPTSRANGARSALLIRSRPAADMTPCLTRQPGTWIPHGTGSRSCSAGQGQGPGRQAGSGGFANRRVREDGRCGRGGSSSRRRRAGGGDVQRHQAEGGGGQAVEHHLLRVPADAPDAAEGEHFPVVLDHRCGSWPVRVEAAGGRCRRRGTGHRVQAEQQERGRCIGRGHRRRVVTHLDVVAEAV